MTSPYGERLHPCARGHQWESIRPGVVGCDGCGSEHTLPPVPADAGRPKPPMRSAPPVPDLRAGGMLSVSELGALKTAARWGLLRSQSRRRFLLTGVFSMGPGDLAVLLREAGGVVDPALDLRQGQIDVVVMGEEPSKEVLELADWACVPVWDEAELVSNLWPTLESLTAQEGEPPF